ncbi:hypothetical protein LTR85_009154 [Meristemomyces frigidus]|nr:hypothetical protein LTR85_009154 [Meristemomyces frigidus]
MAQAIATLKALAEALKLCKPCAQSLTLEGDEREKVIAAEDEIPSDIRYIRTTLTDVTFENTTHQDVIVTGCDWENVVFVNCKMAHVTFSNTKLRNVRLFNVDFRSVRFIRVTIDNALWQDMSVEQTLISMENLKSSERDNRSLSLLRTDSRFSKATAGRLCRLCVERSSYYKHGVGEPGSKLLRLVKLVVVKSKNLMDLPPSVLEKIMAALYHTRRIDIHDRQPTLPTALNSEQTTYRTAACSARERTTYTAYVTDPRSGYTAKLDICTTILRVSKAVFDLAVKAMYERSFCFLSGSENCLAFLHDHRRDAYRISDIELMYSPKATLWSAEPSARSWRLLFNVLVHEREDLQKFTLVFGDAFWEVAPWRDGVDAVFRWTWPTVSHFDDETNDVRPNFLHHVARLSGVSFDTKPLRQCAGDNEKRAVRIALRDRIRKDMKARPRLTKARYGCCVERRLEHCCYYKRH